MLYSPRSLWAQVSGNGLALAGVSIEQDAAYWEWHVEIPDGKSEDTIFGLTTSKDRAFYRELEELDDGKWILGSCCFVAVMPTDFGHFNVLRSDAPNQWNCTHEKGVH